MGPSVRLVTTCATRRYHRVGGAPERPKRPFAIVGRPPSPNLTRWTRAGRDPDARPRAVGFADADRGPGPPPRRRAGQLVSRRGRWRDHDRRRRGAVVLGRSSGRAG